MEDVDWFDHDEEKPKDIDIVVTVNSSVFVEIVCKTKNKTAAVLSGEMTAVGKGAKSSIALKRFMDLFDDSDASFPPPK